MQLTVNAGRPASSRKTSRLHALTVRRVSCTDVHSPLVHTLTPLFWAKIIQQHWWWRITGENIGDATMQLSFSLRSHSGVRIVDPAQAVRESDVDLAIDVLPGVADVDRVSLVGVELQENVSRFLFGRQMPQFVWRRARPHVQQIALTWFLYRQSRVKGCWASPQKKVQMWPFNISKHLGRCVLFRSSCKLAPWAELCQNLTKLK